MAIKRKKRSEKSLTALLFCMLLTTAAFLSGTATVAQGAGVDGVTRYAPAGPAPGAEFEVHLTINGELPLIVGIVETIPEGFDFVSTTCEQYEVSGQKIVFAVIDETEIMYCVKASSSGEGSITGTWIDLLSDKEGSIADTSSVVRGGGVGTTTPKPSPAATPAATPPSEVPGFEAVFTAVALLITSLFVGRWRSKGGGGSLE